MRCAAALLAMGLAGCATAPRPGSPQPQQPAAPAAEVPDYLKERSGCAVVVGGAVGSQFADPQVAAFWQRVNTSVANELFTRLSVQRYKVFSLIVPAEQSGRIEAVAMGAVAHYRCNRLLQISHHVAEDGAGRFFRFDISLMRLQPRDRPAGGGTNVTSVGEFSREYRYARTQETFDSFQTGTFAETVVGDLAKSGALEALR